MNIPAVSIRGLKKSFPVRRSWTEMLRAPFRKTEYTTAVSDVSFEVGAGEFFGLLGPNGAGKTTLFKMLATWIIPDAGTAIIQGHDVVREPQRARRNIASVMANERSLYWRLTAFENLKVHAGLHQMSGAQARQRIQEVLEIVELSETGEKMVGTFSTGMRQRLLIARALLGRPQVLLLDEPTRSLDPISAKSFRNFLREEIAGRQGCAVLLATHSSEEAMDLCDRVGVLHRGTLLAVGTTDELKRRFGDERYLIWTADPTHHAFQQIVQDGLASDLEALPGSDRWVPVRLVIRGGRDRAARVLDHLTGASVSVAGFERIDLSLGDLIERIVNGKRA
jgi:ABC-2 type transport system ATP-binding protein